MKKMSAVLILSLCLSGCSMFDLEEYNASVGADNLEIKRVAVIDFAFELPEKGKIDRGRIRRPQNAGSLMADIFAEHLLGVGLYQIVEREHVKFLMRQHDVMPSQLYASPDWSKFRNALNVDGVVLGSVLDYGEWRSMFNWGGVAAFTARLVDIETGAVVWSVSANRNTAMKNAAVAAHAASEDAIDELQTNLNR